MSQNQGGKDVGSKKRLGLVLIGLPFVAILIILSGFVIVNTLLQASGGSETIDLFRTLINYILGFAGIAVLGAFIICIPLGIIYLLKQEDTSGKFDPRSGKLDQSTIPEEIKGWNWGAAGLTIIWGLYYRVWISLLMFVPIINYFWWIVVGIKGNEWAWRKNKWKSVESFKEAQNKWKPWGIAFLLLPLIIILLGVFAIALEDTSQYEGSRSSKTETTSESPYYKTVSGAEVSYSIKYDSNKWSLSSDSGNKDAEFELILNTNDSYGIIIAERPEFGLETLKNIALDNFRDVGTNVSVVSERTINIDGNDILELKVNVKVDGLPLTYYNHYFSGKIGSIQFITFTYQNLFEEREEELKKLLEGIQLPKKRE